MPCRGEIAEISRIGAEEWSVEWIIRDPLQPSGRRTYYDSPDFRIGDEEWGLRLYPNWGKESRNPSSGWLRIDLDRCDGGPPKTFHISVGIRGSTGVEKAKVVEREFSSRGYYNWVKFCSRSELLDQKSRLIPEDILTITCVIRSTVAARSVSPHPHPPIPVDSVIREPVAPADRSQSSDKRSVLLYPPIKAESEAPVKRNHSSDERDAEFIDVKVLVDGKQFSEKQDAEFKETKVAVHEKQSSEKQDDEFKEAKISFYGKQSSSKQDTEVKEAIAPDNGKLSSKKQDASTQTNTEFKEAIVPVNGKHSSKMQDASSQTDAEFKEARIPVDGKQSSEKQGMEKVAEDMGNLLANGKKSDVTVQVKAAEFKVHSNILSVRSPVLSAMLEHETAEKLSYRISISDCEPDVFKEYLRYIYTGSVQSLTQEIVFDLYRVADKYLADDLKLLCLKHMQNTLCVQTFCDTVKLALSHEESDMLRLAIDFATRNLPLIIRTVEWQNFIREYATEANEILIKCISPGIQSSNQ